jgi:NADH-quinone oxidoreductase subunit C
MKTDSLSYTDDRGKKPVIVSAEEALRYLEPEIPGIDHEKMTDRRWKAKIEPLKVRTALSILKEKGYDHFVALSCVDHLKDDEMELVYHLWSYGSKDLIMISTRVPRDLPVMESVHEIFRPAITYEREIHEMFGVDFPGNPRLTAFILEEWDGPPPMRKDFDSIAFSQEEYGTRIRNPKSLPPGMGKRGDG